LVEHLVKNYVHVGFFRTDNEVLDHVLLDEGAALNYALNKTGIFLWIVDYLSQLFTQLWITLL